MESCPYCNRPLAGEICPAHGYVGQNIDKEIQFPTIPVEYPIGTGTTGFIAPMVATAYGETKAAAIARAPAGWKLCDGTNSTPNIHTAGVPVGIGGGSVYCWWMQKQS